MPQWLPVVITIGIFIVGIYNGVLSYFLRKHMDEVAEMEKQQALDRAAAVEDNQTLRKEFEDFKQQVPFLYVLREDWIRYQTSIDRKLDSIIQIVTELRISGANTRKSGGEDSGGT